VKFSKEDEILIKNLYLSKQHGTQRLLSKLHVKGWKLGSTDNLLKRICKMDSGYNCLATRQR